MTDLISCLNPVFDIVVVVVVVVVIIIIIIIIIIYKVICTRQTCQSGHSAADYANDKYLRQFRQLKDRMPDRHQV
jgi:flagellar biosynthesis/type III secretory pathway M-ring protein FliF/YscJ